MNIKLDHFHTFIVYDGWFHVEFVTLKEAREFIQESVSKGHDIGDFSIKGVMQFEVE
jgi:hypothetical protein